MGEKINLNGKHLKEDNKRILVSDAFNNITEAIEIIDFASAPSNKETKAVLVVQGIVRKSKNDLLRRRNDFYIYNNCYWEKASPDELKVFLTTCSIKVGIDELFSHRIDWYEILLKQLLHSIPREKEVTVIGSKINVLNGTIHITKDAFELKPFVKTDYIFYQLDYNYDPNAKNILLEAHFDYVGLTEETRKIIYAFWAYTLLGSDAPKLEKILLLKGESGTGKSVIYTIGLRLFGKDNISFIPLQKLGEGRGENIPHLEGKLVNISSENKGKFDEEMIKQLASRETLMGRVLYEGSYPVDNIPTFIFNMNAFPSSNDLSGALLRRFLIVEFNKVIPKDKDIKDYGKYIADRELSGIMNRCLEEAKLIIEHQEIPESEQSLRTKDELRIFDNSIDAWLKEDFYTVAPRELKYLMPLKGWYEEYKLYCSQFVAGGKAKGYNLFSSYTEKQKGFAMLRQSNTSQRVYAMKATKEVYKDLNGKEITKEESDREIERLQIPSVKHTPEDEQLPF